MSPSFAIGIAGGTGAGKTTLARRLAEALGHVSLLDLDSYYLDRSGLSRERRARLNFDEPQAFDVSLLLQHLRHLRDGRPVEKPRYSFEHHTRAGFDILHPAPIVVVEGLFALWWEELRSLVDLKVYLDAPPGLRVMRRLRRDVEVRGRSSESVLQQYEATVSPMHDLYVAPTRDHADLVLVNDHDVGPCVRAVCSALQAARSARR
ncbi:MAG: uridine kinase [Candidatus Rokuibacteriota bacterium]